MISRKLPLKQRIRALGERLDSHRKRQQELHPGLTLTVLRQIHDELDEAVLEA